MAARGKAKEALEAEGVLAKLVVTGASFRKVEQHFMGPRPIISLTLENKTGGAISRAYFVGVLKSPGRQVPWLTEEFNYAVPGGIEPGETKKLELSPNAFGEWGQVEPGADAELLVRVGRIDGPDSAGVRYADLVGATRARMELDDEKLHLGEMTLGEWRVSRIAARRFLAALEATARVVAGR